MGEVMEKALEIIASQQFMWGVLVGLSVGFLFWFYSRVLHAQYLYQCFSMESPYKLGKRFCYLITEHEYNLLKIQRKSLKDAPFEE
jgi:hypothetical protein